MAATLGKNIVVLHDEYNLTSSLDNSDLSGTAEPLETTVFGNDSRTYTPGMKDGVISVEGFADPTSTGIDSIQWSDLGSTSTSVTVSNGSTAGSSAWLLDSTQNSFSIQQDVSGLIRINGVYQSVQDGIEKGALIFPITTATASGSGASYDRGAIAATGSVGILHVTAASGTSPTLDVDVEIDDNSSFTSATTLFSFSQKTAIGVERKEDTTDITSSDKYVRISYTIGGSTPSFTFAVSFAAR